MLQAIDMVSGVELIASLVSIYPAVNEGRPSRMSEGNYTFTYEAEGVAGNWTINVNIRGKLFSHLIVFLHVV